MSALVYVALFYTMTDTLLWDLPGYVQAAPASALCGWKGVNSYLSLGMTLVTLTVVCMCVHVSRSGTGIEPCSSAASPSHIYVCGRYKAYLLSLRDDACDGAAGV